METPFLARTVTESAVLALSVADFREHVRDTGTAESTSIEAFIRAATEEASLMTGRHWLQATIVHTYTGFPIPPISLPDVPVASVTSIVYDVNDAETTWDASNYRLLTTGEQTSIFLRDGVLIPNDLNSEPGNVRITYKAGEHTSAATLPALYLSLVRLIAAGLYASRYGEAEENINENPAVARIAMLLSRGPRL